MIRISVEVGRGATRYRVTVQAESIKRALEIVESQNPSCAAKVVFPIEPEEFFVGGGYCDGRVARSRGGVKQQVETNPCVSGSSKP